MGAQTSSWPSTGQRCRYCQWSFLRLRRIHLSGPSAAWLQPSIASSSGDWFLSRAVALQGPPTRRLTGEALEFATQYAKTKGLCNTGDTVVALHYVGMASLIKIVTVSDPLLPGPTSTTGGGHGGNPPHVYWKMNAGDR